MIRSFEWGPWNGMEKINRNGVDVEFSQDQRHVDDVIVGLAHADNSAAASSESHRFYIAHRGDAVLIGVRRANVGMMPLTRVQIVIDALEAGLFQDFQLCFIHQAQGATDADGNLTLDLPDHFGHLVNLSLSWSSAAVDHAIAHSARFFGLEGCLEKSFSRKNRVFIDRSF